MKVSKKWLIVAVLFLLVNMIAATQYAVTKIGYDYYIVHPSDADIRYIGSDNSSDGIRVLRVVGDNITNFGVKLAFGNLTINQTVYYSAAFGIVNEEKYALNITHINVSSVNYTYLKIWLHGDRDANANSTFNDNSSVLMWDNNTVVNTSNTTAWILAAGNRSSSDMCYNVSDRVNSSINTTWDEIAHVRYSKNNTNAVSNLSDFVWVQVAIDVPNNVDRLGYYSGTIWIHFEAQSDD
jgi:hypothetical protein